MKMNMALIDKNHKIEFSAAANFLRLKAHMRLKFFYCDVKTHLFIQYRHLTFKKIEFNSERPNGIEKDF